MDDRILIVVQGSAELAVPYASPVMDDKGPHRPG